MVFEGSGCENQLSNWVVASTLNVLFISGSGSREVDKTVRVTSWVRRRWERVSVLKVMWV